MQGKVAIRVRQLFHDAADINAWKLHECEIQKDHVHILIQTKVSDYIPKVVQTLKGGSSRVVRLEFPELEEFLWGDSFWADGYFAESIGSKDETAMRAYIRNQTAHHAR